MKTQKLISIDHELAVKLSKEKNASALVNDLLIKYYDKASEVTLKLSEEDREKALKLAFQLKEVKEQLRGYGYDV